MHLLWLQHFSPKFKTTGNPEAVSFSPLACARVLEFFLLPFLRPKLLKPLKKCKSRQKRKGKSRVKVKQSSRSTLRNLWRVLRTCWSNLDCLDRHERLSFFPKSDNHRATTCGERESKLNCGLFPTFPQGYFGMFPFEVCAVPVIAWHPFYAKATGHPMYR